MRGLISAVLVSATLWSPALATQRGQATGSLHVAVTARDPDVITNGFFTAWRDSGTDAALTSVRPVFALSDANPNALAMLKPNLEQATAVYGDVLNWERISSEPLGSMLRRDRYLVRMDKLVLRWTFIFGETGAGWTILSWGFEDEPRGWFD